MDKCPANHSETLPENPHEAELEKHSQFYTFDLEKDGGTITGSINGVKREFVIREKFPGLDVKGKVMLALLAKTGYFDGILYNQETHQRIESNIFIFFERLLDIEFTGKVTEIVDSLSLLNALKPYVGVSTVGRFFLGNDFISQIFPEIANKMSEFGQELEPFERINLRILNKNEGNWQAVYDFWSEYVDIKKKFFYLAKGLVQKNLEFPSFPVDINTKIKLGVTEWLNKIFMPLDIDLASLQDFDFANLLAQEIASALRFIDGRPELLDAPILDFKYIFEQSVGDEPTMVPYLTGDTMQLFYLYASPLNFGESVIYFTLPSRLLSHCPVRPLLLKQ